MIFYFPTAKCLVYPTLLTLVLPLLFKISHECLQALANGILSFEVIRMIEQPQPHSMHHPEMEQFAAWGAVTWKNLVLTLISQEPVHHSETPPSPKGSRSYLASGETWAIYK